MSHIFNKTSNPWAGLAPYEEPSNLNPLLFCGRDVESFDLFKLVNDNFFVTIYGKSGIGKTSLLKAGVFPRLRKELYTPIYIRLGTIEDNVCFQDVIIKQIENAIGIDNIEFIDIVPNIIDKNNLKYLWTYFAQHKFKLPNGDITFPVIVFDQFEELLLKQNAKEKVNTLLKQINFLIDESHALDDFEDYSYDFNFRFVVSIREDDLFRLEDTLDNNYLTEMKRCRYRLRSLSEQGANDVVLLPGANYFSPNDIDSIIPTIINIARNKKDGSINTNILSLVCNRIFVEFSHTNDQYIRPSLVDTFIKEDPFEKFYNEATQGFSNKEKAFIEDNFVDSSGRRNSVSENDFLKHVKNGTLLLEGNRKILQRISTSSDGSTYRIELIHDSFCSPLEKCRTNRKQKQKRKRLYIIGSIITLIAFVSFSIIAIIGSLNHNLLKTTKQIQYLRSHSIAINASYLVDNNDSYLAQLITLYTLEQDSSSNNTHIEAEIALRRANISQSAILKGHSSPVHFATPDSSDSIIASASYDNTIRIWDYKSGQCIDTLIGHSNNVMCLSISPDQRSLISGDYNGVIKIWDIEKRSEIKTINNHTSFISHIEYSPDGNLFISSGCDKVIRIWDTESNKCIKELKGHKNAINSAKFSMNCTQIVSASADNTIKIWDIKSGQCLKTLTGHNGYVNFASFSPDGKYIISASDDKTIKIWDSQTGKCINTLTDHTAATKFVSFSSNGKYFVSTSLDRSIRVWNINDMNNIKCIHQLWGHTSHIYSAIFNSTNSQIISASGDCSIRIWDISTDKSVKSITRHKGAVTSLSYNPNGNTLVSSSTDDHIRIWDQNYNEIFAKKFPTNVRCSKYSRNGECIICALDNGNIELLDLKNYKTKCLKGHSDQVNHLDISSDNSKIASASKDGTVRIWELKSGKCIYTLPKFSNMINSVAFSHNNKWIATGGKNKKIDIWEVETGKRIKTFDSNVVTALSFSLDDKSIIIAEGIGILYMYDIESEIKKTFEGNLSFEGHLNYISSISLSPNGKYLASASWDRTIRVWDLETNRCVNTFSGHITDINSVVFSSDGKFIISSSNCGTIKFWDFPPLQELIDKTRERFKNRSLTLEEKKKYYLE